MTSNTLTQVKVADEVWIATALLHREHPSREDFTIDEIVTRARKETVVPELRPGFRVHVLQHCVANRPPNPGRYRMLFATGKHTRRLFRPGDNSHPDRNGAKITPDASEIPARYHTLLAWYEGEYLKSRRAGRPKESILELRGLGKDIWKHIGADEYVRKLREGWE